MFRRLLKAILNNNYLSLISELTIVVIGIFFAFQVDRWWEGRTNHIQEQKYISQLIHDFQQDTTTIENAIQLAYLRLDLANLLIDIANDLNAINGQYETFLVAVNQAAFTHTPSLNSDTFEELRSTGKLSLLKSDTLKSRLFEYYRFDESQRQYNQLQIMTEFKHFELASQTLTLKQQQWVQDSIFIVNPSLIERLNNIEYFDREEILASAKRFQNNPKLISWIPLLREMQLELIWVNKERKRFAEMVLKLLEGNLKKQYFNTN